MYVFLDGENGVPTAETPNSAIPASLLLEINDLQNSGLSFEDAVVNVRTSLVPEGYEPHSFRKDTPESFLDMLRSIVATFVYRDKIKSLHSNGRDFKHHIYVPEVDTITEKEHHDRGDHDHIMLRIANSTRKCRYKDLDPEAFDNALLDPNSGLSHAALIGQRPQSVEDAERLLSHHVAASMKKNGYDFEADYVTTVAGWHEASLGRGMSQLKRSKANYQMLNYLLDELMPWHAEKYDFTFLDINT